MAAAYPLVGATPRGAGAAAAKTVLDRALGCYVLFSVTTAPDDSPLDFSTHTSFAEFGEAEWEALLPAEGIPYLRHSFLRALESTGCVEPERGWMPCHLALRRGGRLVAAAPAYLKGNSEGEFVFDQSWAEFAIGRLGVDYYPKLVVACPFTPATGPRLLFHPGEDPELLTRALATGLQHVTQKLELSSAHVLFPRDAQAQALERYGFQHRTGLQYHWRNEGYASFDEFLQRYRSKHRNQIRRERKELTLQGLELQTLTGSDLKPEHVDHLYDFYIATVDKYVWGRRYLTRAFFEEICATQRDEILAVFARPRGNGQPVAAAFNLLGSARLFGRYWGTRGDYRYLHFNVCYYHGIEQCILRGLEVFEPGAGGEHKVARGFEPTITHSLHFLRNGKLRTAVARFLEQEREWVLERQQSEPGPLRPLPELRSD